jgi:L-alanine-DL-glutamate epimerase-like enolase superfamily enzyme
VSVRVVSVQVEALSIPTVDPFVIATGEVRSTRSVLVRAELRAEGGKKTALGLGEGACLPPVTKEDQPDALTAVDAARAVLWDRVFQSPHELRAALSSVLAETPVARAAVEMAMLDAWARLDEAPLWRWLGGDEPVEILTDITLPILTPQRMAELAKQWSARGFRSFKIKVGKHLEQDLVALKAVCAAVPGASFRPDANAGLKPAEALRWVREARALGAVVECFEQPCASLEEMAEVCAALDVPVLADESVKTLDDLEAVARAKAATGVNLKIAKSGSLLTARAIGLAAQARGWQLMVGGMVESRLGMTAAAHLCASLGGVAFPDLDTAWLLAEDPFEGGYREDGPRYVLPDVPGLGVTRR